MTSLIRRPREPEQAHRNPKTTNHRVVQAVFRLSMGVACLDSFAGVLLVNYPVDDDACCAAKRDTNTNGKECEAGLRSSEEIRWALEDVGEGSEEEEEDTEGKGCVEGEKEHHWLLHVRNSETSNRCLKFGVHTSVTNMCIGRTKF